jgi:hypothetical protein
LRHASCTPSKPLRDQIAQRMGNPPASHASFSGFITAVDQLIRRSTSRISINPPSELIAQPRKFASIMQHPRRSKFIKSAVEFGIGTVSPKTQFTAGFYAGFKTVPIFVLMKVPS